MKKHLTPLNIIFALEVLVVVLAATGLIPREAILVWTGLAIFYMIFSPLQDSLWLVVASIPLFAALPISGTFDTMANWRILIIALSVLQLVKRGMSLDFIRNRSGWHIRENLKHYWLEYSFVGFLAISALSILTAEYKILAIKELLFLLNIALLFWVARNIVRGKERVIKMLKAAAAGGLAVLVVALIQFGVIFFVRLENFWHFWAQKVIPVFYGQNLSDLLNISNSWFAYYRATPPTLRLFSVFPDSHSLAMFLMLMVPVFLCLAVFYAQKRGLKIFYWVLTWLALFGIVFSGSRGAWVGIVPIFTVFIFLKFKTSVGLVCSRKIFLTFGIFGLMFLASVVYPPVYYFVQRENLGYSLFERALSISDPTEISNKGRLEIWGAGVKSIIQKPLLGVGLGNFFIVLNQAPETAKQGASAHNLYLNFAAEIGLPGLIFIFIMFGNILYSAWLVFNKSGETSFRLYALMFGLYFIWILCYSLFDVVLLNDKVLLVFMVDLAALYSLRNITLNPEKI